MNHQYDIVVAGKTLPPTDSAVKFFNNLVRAGVKPEVIERAARQTASDHPKVFNATLAVQKINRDLEAQGYPALEGEPYIVERGTYVCCQVKVRAPRKGRSKKDSQPVYVYGYGFSKYNPNDDKIGIQYDPNVGRRLALSRAVTDCVNTYKRESNAR